MTTAVEIYRAAHDAFNRRDFDALGGMFAADHVFIDHGRRIVAVGPDAFVEIARDEVAMASDSSVTQPEYYGSGAAAVCRFVTAGTNDGLVGGILPATGRRYSVPMLEIVHVSGDKVSLTELFYDYAALMVQLGLSEPLSTAPSLAEFQAAYVEQHAPI